MKTEIASILPAGTIAPPFALPVTPDQELSLSDLRGQAVILAFYPADWSPVCGDHGYPDADIQGIRECTSNAIKNLPADARDYPDAVADALSRLRMAGVNGPYAVLLGAEEYTDLAEARDHGHPVLEHMQRILDGDLVWAPAIEGAFVVTTRGGDFALNIGEDVSIGYLGHTDSAVQLYLQETFVSGSSQPKLP